MWNAWVNKEIDRIRWLVGRLESAPDSLEARNRSKELRQALDRLQMGFWELQDRLDQSLSISQKSANLCPEAIEHQVLFPVVMQSAQEGPKALGRGTPWRK